MLLLQFHISGERQQRLHAPDVLHVVEKKTVQERLFPAAQILLVDFDELTAIIGIFPGNVQKTFPVFLPSLWQVKQRLKRSKRPVQVQRTCQVQLIYHRI